MLEEVVSVPDRIIEMGEKIRSSEGAEVSTLFGSLMKNQIEDQVRRIQKGRNKEFTSDLNDSLLTLERIAGRIWAQSTMRNRQCLWDRLLIWVERNDVPVNQDTVALFVTATKVSKQGMLAYAKAFSGMLKRMGLANETLKQLAAALRADGAAIPLEQAKPIDRPSLIAWSMRQDVNLRDWFTDRVEDGSKMGRSMETGEAEFYFHFCEGNSCRLVGCPEGAKGRSIQAVQMGSDKGISYSGDCTGSAGDGRFRESYKGDDERSSMQCGRRKRAWKNIQPTQ